MKRMQQGFTLIELMIVVAIIGILAAIALPQYQTYIAKTQVSRVMGEVGNYKNAIDQCLLNGRTASVSTNKTVGAAVGAGECVLEATASTLLTGANVGADSVAPAAGTGYVIGAINANGTATLVGTFGNGASTSLTSPAPAKNVTWTRAATGSWTCTSTADAKFLPAGCPAP